jgi:hypothetical protein
MESTLTTILLFNDTLSKPRLRSAKWDAKIIVTSPPKEVVLRISIALKCPLSSAGFQPRTFGPMVSICYLQAYIVYAFMNVFL